MTTTHQTLLLVGASSEIGGAIVDALLGDRQGTVILAGRPSPRRAGACARLREAGHTVTVLEYDAAFDQRQSAALLQQARAVTGTLNTVVVAVGSMSGSYAPVAPEEPTPGAPAPSPHEPNLQHLLLTNLVGPALVANEAASALSLQGHGRLAVVTSAGALRPRLQILGYACAKQALDSFVRGLDRRTKPFGARCIVVRPGRVRTRMTVGLPPTPLTTGPGHVGERVKEALLVLRGSRAVVWSPRFMGPVATVVSRLPYGTLPKDLR